MYKFLLKNSIIAQFYINNFQFKLKYIWRHCIPNRHLREFSLFRNVGQNFLNSLKLFVNILLKLKKCHKKWIDRELSLILDHKKILFLTRCKLSGFYLLSTWRITGSGIKWIFFQWKAIWPEEIIRQVLKSGNVVVPWAHNRGSCHTALTILPQFKSESGPG